MSQSSLITPTIVLITGPFSNSAKFRRYVKFHGKGLIPQLGSYFSSLLRTVGSTYHQWELS